MVRGEAGVRPLAELAAEDELRRVPRGPRLIDPGQPPAEVGAVPISEGEQRVRVRLPAGAKPTRIHLLAAAKTIASKREGEILITKVPSILDHEILAIDL